MLNDNKLEGTLPQELYALESLEWLYLQSNRFNGNISPEIGNLKNLRRLLFRLNDFSGTILTKFCETAYLGRNRA